MPDSLVDMDPISLIIKSLDVQEPSPTRHIAFCAPSGST